MKKLTLLCTLFAATFAMISCSDDDNEKEPVYQTIAFDDCQFASENAADNFAASGSTKIGRASCRERV